MHRKLSLVISIALASMTAVPVLAQDTAGGLEEIIVTAQRREQSLQEVPVSITAFTSAQLERSNIKEAAQYLNLSPNVSYTEDGQQGGTRGISISMRGVSNVNTDESAFIQSIGIYLDEFSVASTAQATINPQLLDLERVEVLRGPQGTYFGRNAVGGALNLTTQKPTDKFEGYVTLGGRKWDTRGEQGDIGVVLNVPVSDTFFLRGVGYYENSSGLVKNIVPNGGDSGHDYTMVRGAARWVPSDATTVDLMAMYSKDNQGLDEAVPSGVWDADTISTFGLNNPYDPNAITAALDNGEGFWPHNQDKVAHTAIGEKNDFETTISVLNIKHAFNDNVTLHSITGLIKTKRTKVFDNDLVPEDLVRRYEGVDADSWSSELRLEVNQERFTWVIGALYSQDKVDAVTDPNVWGGQLGVVTGITTAVDLRPGLAPVPGDGDPDHPAVGDPNIVEFGGPFLPPLWDLGGGFHLWNLTPDGQLPLCLGCNQRLNKLNSIAGFTDFTLHVTDKLDVIAGARITNDDVKARLEAYGLFRKPRIADPSDPSGLTPVPLTDKKTFHDLSPRVSIGYQVNDDARVYGTVSKGYKAGGFSLNWHSNLNEYLDDPFGEEKLVNYELGFKTEWLDHRLRVNGSAFLLKWDDLQLETIYFAVPGDATSNIQKTINVGKAEAKGFEIEFAAAPTDRLTLTGGLGILDTEIKSDDFAILSGKLQVSLKGAELPRSPKTSVNFAAEYRWPIGQREAYLRGEYILKDHQFSTIEDATYKQTSNALVLNDPNLPATAGNVIAQIPDRSNGFPFKSPKVDLFNLRAGMEFTDNWSASVFVENLTNKDYYTSTGDNFGLSGFRLKPHPRVIGATLSYRF